LGIRIPDIRIVIAMSDSHVRFEIDGEIARITLNRPAKRNALTREMVEQIRDAVGAIAADKSIRLGILSAEGPVFCAGMDLGEMQQRAANATAEKEWQQDAQTYRDLLAALVTLPIPTVAIVSGPALAGGLGLVLACDIVLAAEATFFSLPEPKRGITAAVVAALLVYRIAAGPAGFLLLSGESVDARHALAIGLCHEVVSTTQMQQRERELTASILSGAPTALAATKRSLLESASPALLDRLDAAAEVSANARATDEAREGLNAFLEKRKPTWWPTGD
jgi:methylglutaconyl-CoA hydratase